MVAAEKLHCGKTKKKLKSGKAEKKLITRSARKVSRKRASAKSYRTKATVKADKRGTMMMMATIFSALCRPQIACCTSVKYLYRPDYFIVACEAHIYGTFRALGQI